MKKAVRILSICFALILLAGCGSKPTSFIATLQGADGTVSEMHFQGAGDKVEQVTQTTTLDISAFGEAEQGFMDGLLADAKAEMAQKIGDTEGVTHEINVVENAIVETITIDTTNKETIKKLSDAGILPIEGNASRLSMKATKKALQDAGYTITEGETDK